MGGSENDSGDGLVMGLLCVFGRLESAGDGLGEGCPYFPKYWRPGNLLLLSETQIVPSA